VKIISTSVAILLLLGTANLSIIRHFCGGRVAEVKLSILGKASCGMVANSCSTNSYCENNESVSKKPCCEDELTQISITDNYKPATNVAAANFALQLLAVQTNILPSQPVGHVSPVRNYKDPPDYHSVSLPFLQVFLV